MAAARLRFEQSAGLVMKASQLVSVACRTTASMSGKGESAEAKTVSDEGCPHARAARAAAAGATQPSIVLTKAEAKTSGEGTCAHAAGAKGATAMGEGEIKCPKALAAKADALIGESGKILAQWQEAGVRLASMDESARA